MTIICPSTQRLHRIEGGVWYFRHLTPGNNRAPASAGETGAIGDGGQPVDKQYRSSVVLRSALNWQAYASAVARALHQPRVGFAGDLVVPSIFNVIVSPVLISSCPYTCRMTHCPMMASALLSRGPVR